MKHHELLYRLPPIGTGQWLSRNSYWLVHQGKGIVINPSSHLPLDEQMKNAQAKRLDYVVIQQPDPAAIQAVKLWEQAGVSFTVVTHWRTALVLEEVSLHDILSMSTNTGFLYLKKSNWSLFQPLISLRLQAL
jgi:flavorubredoxin